MQLLCFVSCVFGRISPPPHCLAFNPLLSSTPSPLSFFPPPAQVKLELHTPLHGRDVEEQQLTFTLLDTTASKAANIAVALQDKEQEVRSIAQRGADKSVSKSKFAPYLTPNHITSSAVLMVRFKECRTSCAHCRGGGRGRQVAVGVERGGERWKEVERGRVCVCVRVCVRE